MGEFPREESPAEIYHVVNRGAGHQIIFEDDADRAFFLSRLRARARQESAKLLAWCLMDNHIHLLVQLHLTDLSRMMRNLQAEYAGYFNRVHGRSGALFSGRFRSQAVKDEEQLLAVVRYIHQNPVKGGIANQLAYRWSSYNEYIEGRRRDEHAIVRELFKTRQAFIAFHEQSSRACDEVSELGPSRGSGAHKSIPEEDLVREAKELLGEDVARIGSLGRADRDERLAMLKRAGFSVRQIRRLTGVSLGTISKAC